MLSDTHFKVLEYFADGKKVFSGTDIKGGLVISYHDQDKEFKPIEAFTPFPELNSILNKVLSKNKNGFVDSIVSSQGIYHYSPKAFLDDPGLASLQGKGTGDKIVSKSFSLDENIFFDKKPINEDGKFVQLLGLSEKSRKYRFIKKDYLINNDWLEKYNVFVPEANGSGALGEVLSTPLIGQPLIGHTDTFLSIGKFDNEEEAKNLLKYIKTKFARTMLGVLKATQHNPKNTWKYVPLQNFTSKSDLDWEKSISEIDQQLYRKYDLSPEEISFVESHIKEME